MKKTNTLPIYPKSLQCDFLPKISFANQKGGVGKTTSTINTSGALAKLGLKVLVLDTDPQGNASKTLLSDEYSDLMLEIFQGLKPTPLATDNKNIFIIPTTKQLTSITDTLASDITKLFKLKEYLETVKVDIVLIDTPPTLTGISIATQIAATHTIMPISPHYYSLQGANDLVSNFRQLKEHLNKDLEFLGVLVTDFDKRTALANEIKREINSTFKSKVFKNIIPKSVVIEESIVNGLSIVDYKPQSKISTQYLKLAEEIIERLNK